MSTTFMVKSTLVFLVCHINLVLMTILFMFNMSKSATQHYILSVFQVMVYVFGLLFNVYVILYAGRKLELVMKYFENGTNYLRMMQHEIKFNILNSIKVSMEYVSTAVTSIIETCTHLDSEDSNSISSKPVAEIEQFQNSTEESVSKMQTFQEETVGRVEIATVFRNETVTNVQPTPEEKTPELMKMYNLRAVNRPKSDPIKKAVRVEVIKPQSPELLKNKIFKSRMNLTFDSPCLRQDKRNK